MIQVWVVTEQIFPLFGKLGKLSPYDFCLEEGRDVVKLVDSLLAFGAKCKEHLRARKPTIGHYVSGVNIVFLIMSPRSAIRVFSYSTNPSEVSFTRYSTVTGMMGVVFVRDFMDNSALFDNFLQFFDKRLDPEYPDVWWIRKDLSPIVRRW
jgi:hypothetical protein